MQLHLESGPCRRQLAARYLDWDALRGAWQQGNAPDEPLQDGRWKGPLPFPCHVSIYRMYLGCARRRGRGREGRWACCQRSSGLVLWAWPSPLPLPTRDYFVSPLPDFARRSPLASRLSPAACRLHRAARPAPWPPLFPFPRPWPLLIGVLPLPLRL